MSTEGSYFMVIPDIREMQMEIRHDLTGRLSESFAADWLNKHQAGEVTPKSNPRCPSSPDLSHTPGLVELHLADSCW